jgi:uncharacterized protein YdiU (UPF0061 family)
MSDARIIEMKDGRKLSFGEKQKMAKDYGTTEDGQVFVQIDFDNGETVKLVIDPTSATGLQAAGHGLSQKLGDAAAGADNTNDAFEAVLEVASRVANGEWTKARAAGDGTSAKGASELVEALVKVLSQPKETVREMLSKLKQADKMALRKTPAVAQVIEALRAARAPSKAEKEKEAAGANLLAALQAGQVPESTVVVEDAPL